MYSKTQKLMTAQMITIFKHGAIVTHFGYEDEDSDMQLVGIKGAKRAIEVLDRFGPEARLALVPLLEDPDWSIRVFAAGYLVRVMPERAVAVLEEIYRLCPTTARWTASNILLRHKQGKEPN